MRRLLPPLLTLIALLVMLALDRLVPLLQLVAPPLSFVGYAVFAAGFAMVMAGGWQFHQARTNIRTFNRPDRLVTGGLFRLSRNPMYLGMALMLAGAAIRLGSASSFLVVAGFVIIADRWYIAFEERTMEAVFGAAYRDYRRRVRRWI